MFEFRDLFQWDRFITPTIIKTFYWLVIALITLFGISGIFSGLAAMAISPFGGFILLLSSIAGVVVFCELWIIAFVRTRYMDTPFFKAALQIVLGGAIVLAAGILIGAS